MSASTQTLTTAGSQQLLASLWQRNLPLLRQRLANLNAAAFHATAGQLSEDARKEAASIAHKLAGSLGMFGYFRGTELARELEILLDAEGPLPSSLFEELTRQLNRSLPI